MKGDDFVDVWEHAEMCCYIKVGKRGNEVPDAVLN